MLTIRGWGRGVIYCACGACFAPCAWGIGLASGGRRGCWRGESPHHTGWGCWGQDVPATDWDKDVLATGETDGIVRDSGVGLLFSLRREKGCRRGESPHHTGWGCWGQGVPATDWDCKSQLRGGDLVEGAGDAEAVLAGGDVEVDFGGGDVFVAEDFLDGAEIGAVFEQVGGE